VVGRPDQLSVKGLSCVSKVTTRSVSHAWSPPSPLSGCPWSPRPAGAREERVGGGVLCIHIVVILPGLPLTKGRGGSTRHTPEPAYSDNLRPIPSSPSESARSGSPKQPFSTERGPQ
jgi:hypothetical protein